MEPWHQQPKRSKNTSTQHSNTQTVFVFPTEIISEILSRLSVKSLLRFRCVSKAWCSFISSSEFVKLHLKVSASRKDYAHHKLLTSLFGPRLSPPKQCSLQSLISEPITKAVEVDYPMKNSPHDSVLVVGSCHGLICIAIDGKHLFIWNPTIRKFKKVPDSGAPARFNSTYGFGYDEVNDDYKVVGIFYGYHTPACESDSKVKVMVYSLSSDSWKRIGGFKGAVPLDDAGKYVNGKMHWAAGPPFSGWEIVSLDLARETFGKVEHPNYGGIKSDLTLGVVCDYLCVLSQHGGLMDFWVMREYGVYESWTKIVINPFYPVTVNTHSNIFTFPLCITENGEVVLVFGSTVIVYDPEKKVLRYNEITNFGAIGEMEIYVESLVSPIVNSEAGREEQITKAMD